MQILITAGPTREAIDPVRYISNHSTGKMGIAIANAFAQQNCKVDLVLGPTHLLPEKEVNVKHVISAKEMFEACKDLYAKADISVFTAAVADYTPLQISAEKIKKSAGEWQLRLIKTKDIAFELGKLKKAQQVNVIFALETENEAENALQKLERKNADLVVLNSIRDAGAGFGYDTNKITIFFRNGLSTKFALQSKQSLAAIIVKEALTIFHNKQT